jgi:glutathione S-transferase
MTAGQSHDGRGEADATEEIEGGLQRTADRSDRLPSGLMHLAEKERAQKISLRQLFAEQEHELRQKYADWIIWLLGAQFVIADVVFIAFAWAGRRWDLPSGVIEVWLVATVVQVVGVVAVVTRHLFPAREEVGV